MKTINDYIQEKLYIGRDYKSSYGLMTDNDFVEYLNDHNLVLNQFGKRWYDIFPKRAINGNVYMVINKEDDYFVIDTQLKTDKKFITIINKNLQSPDRSYKADNYGMDMKKVDGKNVFEYTKKNADAIIEIFKNEKTK